MKNKDLANQYDLLKRRISEYIIQKLGRKKLHLKWTFRNIEPLSENTDVPTPYCVSEIFVSKGDVYIKIYDEAYPEETEETLLVDESMDVVYRLCELVENETASN